MKRRQFMGDLSNLLVKHSTMNERLAKETDWTQRSDATNQAVEEYQKALGAFVMTWGPKDE